MANITGKYNLANFEVYPYCKAEFHLSAVDTDADAAYIPDAVSVVIGSDGSISAELWANDQGSRGTTYSNHVVVYCDSSYQRELKRINMGKIAVVGDAEIQDLLVTNIVPSTQADALALAQAAASAAADSADVAADSAAAAADSADAAADSAAAAADSADAAALFDPGFYQPADSLLTEIATEGTVIPLSSAGQALIQAADSAAQLTLLGVSAAGKAMIQAANSAAQLTLLTPPCLVVQDVKAAGVDGGTFTAGAWRTRDLNTVQTNTITGASLAANRVTLPAGVYRVHATAPAYRVQHNQIRLQQITPSAATLLAGTIAYSGDVANNSFAISQIVGRITLAATATIELQHWGTNTVSGNGFGSTSTALSPIYSQIVLERIGDA